MKIIFESYLYPDTFSEQYKANSKCILDYAAHNLCKAILVGLKENGVNIRLVNAPNIGSFPAYYKTALVRGCELKDGISISFCNIAFLKRFSIRRKLKKNIEKELNAESISKDTVLFLYNYRCLPFLPEIKKHHPDIKVVMVVTDLPGYMIMAPSKLMYWGGKVLGDGTELKKDLLDCVDGFVLLAPEMKEVLSIGDKPWIQIEGIFNSDTTIGVVEKSPYKTVLYSGNLGLRYGIGKLLEAFNGIPDANYRLWICGNGDGLEEVLKYSSKDRRIDYKGILSRKEVLELQKKATILINPRNSSDEYTRFSFPSKTMEYLASGTPVVMSHLPSIPQDYDKHIYYLLDESVEGLRQKIIEVCSLTPDVLRKKGEDAISFIMKEKTPKPQTKKIIDFIETLS